MIGNEMNMKHTLLLCGLLAYPTQSWATRVQAQPYAQARVGIHAFAGTIFKFTGVVGDTVLVKAVGNDIDLQK